MTQLARPQEGKSEEKDPQWPIPCTRQNLLTACWGSKKGADLLYHFANKARWEIKNQRLSKSVKVVKFNEEREEIFEGIKKAREGNSLSQGMYSTLLREFIEVGYIVNLPYSTLFEVNLEVIEKAFSNPPQRPVKQGRKPDNTDESCVKMTDHNNDTIGRAEYNSLVEVCVNLSKSCQSLSIQVVELTSMCQSLMQNPSINTASQNALSATTGTQNHDYREVMLNDDEESANAPLTLPFTQEEIALIVRSRIPEGDAILLERLDHGSHHIYRKSGLPIGELIPVGVDVSEGLLALITVDSTAETTIDALPEGEISYSHNSTQTPALEQNTENTGTVPGAGYKTSTNTPPQEEKPAKRNSRSKKEKVEQPPLLDTNTKAVAFNDAEQQQFEWYCCLDFIHVRPDQDVLKKQHCKTLSAHVHSLEDMKDLAAFAKTKVEAQLKRKIHIVKLGNMANKDTLNEWLAQQKIQTTNQPTLTQEIDPSKPVIWTRYKHQGTARSRWYLYEVMLLSEAQKFGYKSDVIPPNDRQEIKTLLKSLAEGRRQLTPEQKQELETAELRLHLVA